MGSMSSNDVAARVRRQFGDDDGAQVVDADIIRWINDAQREIAVQHDLMQTKGTSATTANISAYNLPANILRFRSCKYMGIALKSMSQDQADASIPSNDQTVAQGFPVGTPVAYWIYAGQINLFPAPAQDGTTDLTIYYTSNPADITVLDATVLILPPEYHNSVVEYCLKQAYELDANLQMIGLKTQDFQGGLDKLRSNQEWNSQDVYPNITSIPEYDYGLG